LYEEIVKCGLGGGDRAARLGGMLSGRALARAQNAAGTITPLLPRENGARSLGNVPVF
jgi:hypothetical protein